MKRLFFLVAASMLIPLFASFPAASKPHVAVYSVVLSSVESPVDSKDQFGETKIVTIEEGGVSKYRYEDDYISIVWNVLPQKLAFTLTNKTDHILKINWDDISFVDIGGRAGRVMHAGVKYVDRNNSQPPTTIPKGANISDILLPTENVSYVMVGNYSRWDIAYLIPCIYKKKDSLQRGAPLYIGKTMSVLMPIMIENVQNDYTFVFTIDELLTPLN